MPVPTASLKERHDGVPVFCRLFLGRAQKSGTNPTIGVFLLSADLGRPRRTLFFLLQGFI
ncbi:hypothetical protein pneo_cds_978 [Pandoravirus neocaledonia]|uniref:Uncharacterized protein n=1 Tax=Pandoravirus neocaledonia TaxID=2107708 RepID=A0A2U7UE03_9VIRU|nr:hypothetical protein pneo_cds_978 [Pandoravirus neocaledonia]AVK76585.1 hypothetical protein pneo_cds_978 [Pandoravirus neocaledonia]